MFALKLIETLITSTTHHNRNGLELNESGTAAGVNQERPWKKNTEDPEIADFDINSLEESIRSKHSRSYNPMNVDQTEENTIHETKYGECADQNEKVKTFLNNAKRSVAEDPLDSVLILTNMNYVVLGLKELVKLYLELRDGPSENEKYESFLELEILARIRGADEIFREISNLASNIRSMKILKRMFINTVESFVERI